MRTDMIRRMDDAPKLVNPSGWITERILSEKHSYNEPRVDNPGPSSEDSDDSSPPTTASTIPQIVEEKEVEPEGGRERCVYTHCPSFAIYLYCLGTVVLLLAIVLAHAQLQAVTRVLRALPRLKAKMPNVNAYLCRGHKPLSLLPSPRYDADRRPCLCNQPSPRMGSGEMNPLALSARSLALVYLQRRFDPQ